MQERKCFFRELQKHIAPGIRTGGNENALKSVGPPSPRAFWFLKGYNWFRGSINRTGTNGTHPTHSNEHVDMRDRFLPSVYSGGLQVTKPYECLSNISHDFQTYAYSD